MKCVRAPSTVPGPWQALRTFGLNLNLNLTLLQRQSLGPNCEMGPWDTVLCSQTPGGQSRGHWLALLPASLPQLGPGPSQTSSPLQHLWGSGHPFVSTARPALSREEAEGCEGLVCVTLFIFSEGSCLSPAIKITCLETSSLRGRKRLLYSEKWLQWPPCTSTSAPHMKEALVKVMRGQGPSGRVQGGCPWGCGEGPRRGWEPRGSICLPA